MTRFIVVPQWQGSPSSRAMALADGAEAIAGDLPRSAVVRIEVPAEAGESIETGVRRASSLLKVRAAVADALVSETDRCLLIGGDCSVAIAGVAHVATESLAVIWFDAHADLNDTASSPSGAFSGMTARALIGDVPPPLGLEAGTVAPSRLFLAATRALDEEEAAFLNSSEITLTDVASIADPEELVLAVKASGAKTIYIHVDLDTIDPAAMAGVHNPVPFGLDPAALTTQIKALKAVFPLVGASLSGFAPSSPAAAVDDLGTILRVIGALSS